MTRLLKLIISLITITIIFCSNDCIYTDENGQKFDLSPLNNNGSDWLIRDPITSSSSLFGIQYLFNLCKDVSSTCKGSAIYEVLEVMGALTQTCEMVGKPEHKQVTYITSLDGTKSLEIVMPDGDVCVGSENIVENGLPKKAQFQIVCDKLQQNEWEYVHVDGVSITRCSPLFKIRSPAGCSQSDLAILNSSNSHSNISTVKLLLLIFIIGGLYIGIGVLYNMKKNGKSGFEALPNLHIWSNFYSKGTQGFQNCMTAIKNFTGKFKRNQDQNLEYITV